VDKRYNICCKVAVEPGVCQFGKPEWQIRNVHNLAGAVFWQVGGMKHA
jgi:hypothetical protein